MIFWKFSQKQHPGLFDHSAGIDIPYINANANIVEIKREQGEVKYADHGFRSISATAIVLVYDYLEAALAMFEWVK
jgi:hypothetical protein